MKDQGETIVVDGLVPLRKALKQAGEGADKRLTKDLRVVGKLVQTAARSLAPTGPRPRRSNTPPLAGSVRLSLVTGGASVYSNNADALVQDRGGTVGHGAVITAARASGYMSKAVASQRETVNQKLEGLLSDLEHDFATGA